MLFVCINVKAQVCNTPSPAPPGWMLNSSLRSGQAAGIYTLRIFIHIVRSSSGSGLGSGIVSTIVSKLNSDYANAGIQFQLSGSNFIDNNTYYNDLAGSEYTALFATDSHSNAIDLYVLGTSTNTYGYGGMAASIPSTALWVRGDCTTHRF
jgi:hypothetical protein